MVGADQSFLLFLILGGVGIFSYVLTQHRSFSFISPIVLAIFISMTLSNLNVIPNKADFYSHVWKYCVLIAIPFYLFESNFKRIFQYSGAVLVAFTLGSIGVVVGCFLAYFIADIGPETSKMIAMLGGSQIGGTINLMALTQVLDLQDKDLLVAGSTADLVMMALYFVILGAMAKSSYLNKAFSFYAQEAPTSEGSLPLNTSEEVRDSPFLKVGFYGRLGFALMLSFVFIMIALRLAGLFDVPGLDIILLTVLSLLFANLLPKTSRRIGKDLNIFGILIMQVFFSVIGAECNLMEAFTKAPKIFLMMLTILTCHFAFIILGGRYLKIDLRKILLASNTCVGGTSTAVAFAASEKWTDLAIPAILCGTLGYAVGTFIGMCVHQALSVFG